MHIYRHVCHIVGYNDSTAIRTTQCQLLLQWWTQWQHSKYYKTKYHHIVGHNYYTAISFYNNRKTSIVTMLDIMTVDSNDLIWQHNVRYCYNVGHNDSTQKLPYMTIQCQVLPQCWTQWQYTAMTLYHMMSDIVTMLDTMTAHSNNLIWQHNVRYFHNVVHNDYTAMTLYDNTMSSIVIMLYTMTVHSNDLIWHDDRYCYNVGHNDNTAMTLYDKTMLGIVPVLDTMIAQQLW